MFSRRRAVGLQTTFQPRKRKPVAAFFQDATVSGGMLAGDGWIGCVVHGKTKCPFKGLHVRENFVVDAGVQSFFGAIALVVFHHQVFFFFVPAYDVIECDAVHPEGRVGDGVMDGIIVGKAAFHPLRQGVFGFLFLQGAGGKCY